MLGVQKQTRENNQGLIFRFTRGIQKSGILLRKKRANFFQRSPSKQTQKRAALRRVEIRKEREKLKKLER